MTNQDYMDVLEKYASSEVVVDFSRKNAIADIESIKYSVLTTDYSKDGEPMFYGMDATPKPNIDIIIISDSTLKMYVPNMMDLMIERGVTHYEYTDLFRTNANLFGIKSNRLQNQISGNQLLIPYYEDEAESFQRELSGEIILYKSHLKYVHQIVERGHKKMIKLLNETWDSLPKM